MRFRKKPAVIEAEQVRLNTLGPCADGGTCANNPFTALVMRRPRWWRRAVPMLLTASGWVAVLPQDWVCRQFVDGRPDYWPVRPDVFAATYEDAEAVLDDFEAGAVICAEQLAGGQ